MQILPRLHLSRTRGNELEDTNEHFQMTVNLQYLGNIGIKTFALPGLRRSKQRPLSTVLLVLLSIERSGKTIRGWTLGTPNLQ